MPFPSVSAPPSSPPSTAALGAPGTLANGAVYFELDSGGKVVAVWEGTTAAPVKRLTTTDVAGYGAIGARPTAAAAGDKAFYTSTDETPKVVYQVQSGAWVAVASIASAVAMPVVPGLLLPLASQNFDFTTTGNPTANLLTIMRFMATAAGTLKDLAAYISTASGNALAVVMDTGDANAGKRTVLWTSGPVVPASTSWLSFGNPNIALAAGQMFDVGVMFDNATITLPRKSLTLSGLAQLPANYVPVAGGAAPKLLGAATGFTVAGGIPVGQQIAEASVSTATFLPHVVCRNQ